MVRISPCLRRSRADPETGSFRHPLDAVVLKLNRSPARRLGFIKHCPLNRDTSVRCFHVFLPLNATGASVWHCVVGSTTFLCSFPTIRWFFLSISTTFERPGKEEPVTSLLPIVQPTCTLARHTQLCPKQHLHHGLNAVGYLLQLSKQHLGARSLRLHH